MKKKYTPEEQRMLDFTVIYLDVIKRGFKKDRNYWFMDQQFSESELGKDELRLQEHVLFNPLFPISEDEKEMVISFLSVISKFEIKEKICMYCHYVLGIPVRNIQRNEYSEDGEYFYNVSRPYDVIQRGIYNFGLSQDFDRLDYTKLDELKSDMDSIVRMENVSNREAMILFSFLNNK